MVEEQSSLAMYYSNNHNQLNCFGSQHQQQLKYCGMEGVEQSMIPQQNYFLPPSIIQKGTIPGINFTEEHGGGQLERSRGDSIGFIPLASSNFDELNYFHQEQIPSNNYLGCEQPLVYPNTAGQYQPQNNFGEDCLPNRQFPHQPYSSHHQQTSLLNSHLQEPLFNYNHLLNTSANFAGSSYNPNAPCQLPIPSSQYLQQDQLLQPNNNHNGHPLFNPQNFFQYGQQQPTSLNNLCFDYEAMIGTIPDEKYPMYGVQDTFTWQDNPLAKSDNCKDTNNIQGNNSSKIRIFQRSNMQLDNLAIQQQQQPEILEKTTEKLKQKRKHAKTFGFELSKPMKNIDNPSSDSSSQKRQSKKQSLSSEATTVFDRNANDPPSTPYKKIKLNEFTIQNQLSLLTCSKSANEQIHSNNGNNYPTQSLSINNKNNKPNQGLHLLAEKSANSDLATKTLLPNKTSVETLQGIMKSLPLAYLPFLHKQQSDSQKLDYLKRYHNTALQVDLGKLRQILPNNFIKSFDVNPSEVYSNAFIMEGIRRNLPDESAKKIGPLTRRERRDKINKYKQKRNKRASCRKVSYDVRKRVADSRLRVKGRFVTKDQALQMIGDVSGDIDRYSNQELRALLVQRFGSENANDSPISP